MSGYLQFLGNNVKFFNVSPQQSKSTEDSAQHLDMANVGGVFFVLLSGCGIAFLYALCEWYYYMRKRARQKHISFREEFKREAKFVMDVHNNTRKLRDSDDDLSSIHGDSSKME